MRLLAMAAQSYARAAADTGARHNQTRTSVAVAFGCCYNVQRRRASAVRCNARLAAPTASKLAAAEGEDTPVLIARTS